MLKQEMEGMAVVMMLQMTEFMEQYIIAEGVREADNVQVEIDVVPRRTAAPIGSVVLDGQAVEDESISFCQFGDARRKFGFGTATEVGDFLR